MNCNVGGDVVLVTVKQKHNLYDKIIIIQGDPKNGTHIFLTEIHKFNSSLFFFSGY